MNKIVNIVFIVVVIFLTWQVQSRWFPTVEREIVTDTTYVDRPFEVEKIIEKQLPPETVTRYVTEYDTIKEVRVETDTVFVETDDDTFTYHPSFLTQYPEAHKLLGLVYQEGDLALTTLSPDGVTDTNKWNVGDRNYRVGVNVALQATKSKKVTFGYEAQAGWIQFYELGSPYLAVSGNFRILSVDLTGTININKYPFGMVGINYRF